MDTLGPLPTVRRGHASGVLLAALCLVLAACEVGVRKRAYGYMRVGKVEDLRAAPETYLPDKQLLLRYDAGGFSAMSTACTFDVSSLERVPSGDSYIFASSYTASRYDRAGKVLHGPAKADLPYYRLWLGRSEDNGPPDAIYVAIGEEVPPAWRLKAEPPPEG